MVLHSSLKIRNLELQNLSDINLIVGQNGIGKSKLLRSLYFDEIDELKCNKLLYRCFGNLEPIPLFDENREKINDSFKKIFLKYVQIFNNEIIDIEFDWYTDYTCIRFTKNNNEKFLLGATHYLTSFEQVISIIFHALTLENGILLLDDFGGNLSYNTSFKLWNILIEISKMNNLQIFAAVQNMDSIISLHNTEHSISLYRLGKSVLEDNKGQLIATHYSRAEIDTCIRHNIEMR